MAGNLKWWHVQVSPILDSDDAGELADRFKLLRLTQGVFRQAQGFLGFFFGLGVILLVEWMAFTIDQTNLSVVIKVLTDSIDEHYRQTICFPPAPTTRRDRRWHEP